MTDEVVTVLPETNGLEYNDPPRLVWVPVREAVGLLWAGNPKLHSIGDLVQSIERYGLQELPKFDANLENRGGGRGAIVAGNGRVEALAWMEQDGRDLPRGIAKGPDGAWALPVLAGVDQPSEEMAAAYAVDSNNLTLAGGGFDAFDMARLWDEEAYVALVESLGDMRPVTVDGEALDALIGMNGNQNKKTEPIDILPEYAILIECDSEQAQVVALEELVGLGYQCRALIS